MSIEALKREMEGLDLQSCNEMIAYLMLLRERHDPERMAELTRRLDEKDPSRWVRLEDVEASFAARHPDFKE